MKTDKAVANSIIEIDYWRLTRHFFKEILKGWEGEDISNIHLAIALVQKWKEHLISN